MRFVLDVNLDNFEPEDCAHNLAYIVTQVAAQLTDMEGESIAEVERAVRDLNGNTVGQYYVEED